MKTVYEVCKEYREKRRGEYQIIKLKFDIGGGRYENHYDVSNIVEHDDGCTEFDTEEVHITTIGKIYEKRKWR